MDASKLDSLKKKRFLIAMIFVDKNEELRKEEKFATILEYLPYRKADWT